MATVFDVANFFIDLQRDEMESDMTPLKLQKLVYYAQGFSLALLKRPLFSEDFQAWKHGPVCPELYQRYRAYGREAICGVASDYNYKIFDTDETDLLMDVYGQYGQYSASTLRNMSHTTSPWINAASLGWGSCIEKSSMQAYFITLSLERYNDIVTADVLEQLAIKPHPDATGKLVFPASEAVEWE